jgi:UDP-glucuronate decarboxylase
VNKRILVTEGAGFLGSHLYHRLVAAGHQVMCVDNFFSGARENIEDLLANARFEQSPISRHTSEAVR